MQLELRENNNFELNWSVDMELVKNVIESCIVRKVLHQAGDYLLTQGGKLTNLLLIERGEISMGYSACNGRCFQLGTIKCESHIFGELEFFTGHDCQIDIVAVEALEAYIIDTEKLRTCLLKEGLRSRYFLLNLSRVITRIRLMSFSLD